MANNGTCMKGLIFSEFLEYVESTYSAEMVDDIIDACSLSSDGAYTTVGSYPHEELVSLVAVLSEQSSTASSEILRSFGNYLFERLIIGFPHFTHNAKSAFELLYRIEEYMNQEVRKLYPDAKLPTFAYEASHPNQLIITYHSMRPFADLAHGMIEGVINHFGEDINIERDPVSSEEKTHVRFSLELKDA
jgi:hypothetical protein